MEPTIFLSYAREDGDWTRRLRSELDTRGILSWFDEADIPVSVPWLQEVEAGIAQSVLFVSVESEHWHRSDPCSNELAIAKQAGVRRIALQVGGDVRVAAAAVARGLADVEAWEVERISLARRSSAWKAGERRNGALARGRSLQRTRRTMSGHLDAVDETSRKYLVASVRRRHRVRFIAVMATVLVIALIGVPAFTQLLERAANVQLDHVVAGFADQAEQQEQISYNPYLGLSAVSTDHSTGFLADSARVDALAAVLPFEVAKASAVHSWSASRTATAHSATMVATVERASARIVVRDKAGDVAATVYGSGPVTALAWSPDDQALAAVETSKIELIRIADGTLVQTLEGAGPVLDAVVWSAVGDRVSARSTDSRAFTWHAFTGQQLSKVDGVGYLRVARLATGELAAVTTTGEVRVLDTSGRVHRIVPPPARPALVIAGASDARRVAVLDEVGQQARVWIWDRSTARTVQSAPIGCAASDLAFAGTRVVVTCSDDHMAAVDARSGRVLVVPSDEQWLSVGVRKGHIYVGSSLGSMNELSNDLRTRHPTASLACGGPIRSIVSAGGSVFGMGVNATQIGCVAYARIEGTGAPHSGFAPPFDSRYCVATATSLDSERLALGCDDGTVLVFSSGLEPLWKGRVTPGPIRSVAFDTATSIVAATRDGRLARVVVPSLSATAGRRQAALAVQQAEQLGLYRPRSS